MSSFTERMIGAARLDIATYEEVEADTTATGQALLVVVLSSIAAGLSFVTVEGFSGLIWGTVGEIHEACLPRSGSSVGPLANSNSTGSDQV